MILAQAHIPTKQEIIDWFDKLKKVDGAENALQKQVINTFVHKVFLWDEKAIIVLTLNNTQETVTIEQIRDYESLAEEKQKPLTEISASGSCYMSFGYTLRNRFFVSGLNFVQDSAAKKNKIFMIRMGISDKMILDKRVRI